MRVIISALMLLLVVSCSQNNDTIYDCDGVEVVINVMKRKFVVSGVDLGQKDGFFMNQSTVFGKFYDSSAGTASASFNKINNELIIIWNFFNGHFLFLNGFSIK